MGITAEEAIEELENATLLIIANGKDWMDERDLPVLEMAIDALKKQIPMKPDEHLEQVQKHMNLGVKAPFCPKCGNDLLDEKNDCYNFCPHCGQVIDWSECNGSDSQNQRI